jgi:hypothetical protein
MPPLPVTGQLYFVQLDVFVPHKKHISELPRPVGGLVLLYICVCVCVCVCVRDGN